MSAWLAPFQLDLRSLALGRIFLGLIVAVDFGFAIARRSQFYNEYGVFPRRYMAQMDSSEQVFSPYLVMGWPVFTNLLLVLSLLVAVAYALGWKTKWTKVLIWFAVLSLQERNRLVLIGGDAWIRQSLFWLMFLPVGEYFSLDQSEQTEGNASTTITNAATLGFVLQTTFVYFWAGLAKYGEDWWKGDAIYYVLHGPEFGYGLAKIVLYFPTALSWVCVCIPMLEIVAGLAIISPFKNRYCRLFGVTALAAMHVGIWCTMELYHFSAVAIATLLCLFPIFVRRGPERKSPVKMGKVATVGLVFMALGPLLYSPYRVWKGEETSRSLQMAANFLGFQQIWGLFAPTAPRSAMVIFAVAELNDGSLQPVGFWGEKRAKTPTINDPDFSVRLSRYWRSINEGPNRANRLRRHAEWYSNVWARKYPDQAEELSVMRIYHQGYPIGENFEDIPPQAPVLLSEDVPSTR